MATPQDSASDLSGLLSDEDSRFLIHSSKEIRFILHAIQQESALVNVYFGSGIDSILTTILDVPEHGDVLILDYGPDESCNRRAQEAGRVVLQTWLEKVKIQFTVEGLEKVMFDGSPAFRAALPEKLSRMQRREFYRLVTPLTQPLICTIPLPEGAPRKKLEGTVVDISIGGVGILDHQQDVELVVGAAYPDCRLALPGRDPVIATIEIRSTMDLVLKNGVKGRRCGCSFVNVPGSVVAMIQRYIIETERERNARLSGMR